MVESRFKDSYPIEALSWNLNTKKKNRKVHISVLCTHRSIQQTFRNLIKFNHLLLCYRLKMKLLPSSSSPKLGPSQPKGRVFACCRMCVFLRLPTQATWSALCLKNLSSTRRDTWTWTEFASFALGTDINTTIWRKKVLFSLDLVDKGSVNVFLIFSKNIFFHFYNLIIFWTFQVEYEKNHKLFYPSNNKCPSEYEIISSFCTKLFRIHLKFPPKQTTKFTVSICKFFHSTASGDMLWHNSGKDNLFSSFFLLFFPPQKISKKENPQKPQEIKMCEGAKYKSTYFMSLIRDSNPPTSFPLLSFEEKKATVGEILILEAVLLQTRQGVNP